MHQMGIESIKTEEDAESHFSLLPEDLFADSRCLRLRIGGKQSGEDAEEIQLGACQSCARRW